jgi:hypothetical protein
MKLHNNNRNNVFNQILTGISNISDDALKHLAKNTNCYIN